MPYPGHRNTAVAAPCGNATDITTSIQQSCLFGTFQRPPSTVNVAAADIHRSHSHYRGPFVYEHYPSFSDFSLPVFDTAIRSRRHNSRTSFKADHQRPWSDPREREGNRGRELMSDRPADQGQPETSTGNDSSRRSQQDGHYYAQQPGASTLAAASPTFQRTQQATTREFELPPLPQGSSSTAGSYSPSALRLAGVSSILNPTQSDEHGKSRRRKASELESPRGSTPSLPPIAMSNQPSQVPSARIGASPISSFSGLVELQPRRILTPRSPALHRATSLSQLAPLTATISAQQNPFPASPRGRAYAIEPGTSGAPPMPTPPAALRQGYGFPPATGSSEAARRASSGPTRHTGMASASTSPTTSYSDYSQADEASPAAQYGAYSAGGGQERQRQMGIPISSSGGQNVYQMMTLETTSGTVQLPVDVQGASRVADEKRRRNAGASARFRQRRKEKEKEASTQISRLEQQVKDLGEDADFYKRERDYMATVVLQVPGGDRHFPRPPSPKRRRSSSALGGGSGGNYGTGQDQAPRSPEQGRNVRRRTSTLSLPPPPPQTALQPHGAPFQPGYGPQTFGTPIAPHPQQFQQAATSMPSPLARGMLPPTPLPPMQQPPASGHPQLMQAPPQTGPWNPYASERRPQGPPGPPRDAR